MLSIKPFRSLNLPKKTKKKGPPLKYSLNSTNNYFGWVRRLTSSKKKNIFLNSLIKLWKELLQKRPKRMKSLSKAKLWSFQQKKTKMRWKKRSKKKGKSKKKEISRKKRKKNYRIWIVGLSRELRRWKIALNLQWVLKFLLTLKSLLSWSWGISSSQQNILRFWGSWLNGQSISINFSKNLNVMFSRGSLGLKILKTNLWLCFNKKNWSKNWRRKGRKWNKSFCFCKSNSLNGWES